MSTFVLLLLLFGMLFIETKCGAIYVTENPQVWASRNNNEGELLRTENARRYNSFPRHVSSSIRDLRSSGNPINDTPRRRSKFLGGLAFLAGLSVGGLASAASSSVKSFAKLPPASVTLNVGPPRITPYLSAYYDPYSLIPHHYFYPNPFGLFPFVDPSKFHSQPLTGQIQNGFHPSTTQNHVLPEVVSVLDNKRPSDVVDNDEEYIEENKKVESEKITKDKTSKRTEEESVDQGGLEEQADQHEEQEMTTRFTPCTEKHRLKKPASNSKNTPKIQAEEENYHEEEDDTEESSDSRAGTTTGQTATNTTATNKNSTLTATSPASQTTNTTMSVANSTNYPPFMGYYGGNPQPINNYDFTTEQYFDYNQVSYGLPSQKPANFHPYEAYPPFQSPESFFSSGSYLPEPPDYLNNGYDRLSSIPESVPPHVSGFRPNYFRSL